MPSRMKFHGFDVLAWYRDLRFRHVSDISNRMGYCVYPTGCGLFSLSTRPYGSPLASSAAPERKSMTHCFQTVDSTIRRATPSSSSHVG